MSTGHALVKAGFKARETNPRQLKFAALFVKTGNATQAYVDAGYSPNGADGAATKLQANASVAAEIARLKAEYAKSAGIDTAWVLERMKAHVEAELPDLFDDQGELLHPKQWPAHMRRLVDKVKIVQKRTGHLVMGQAGTPILVPMYVKEVTLESKTAVLKHLLDFVSGTPSATPPGGVTNNIQVNVDKALINLRAAIHDE